MSSSCIKVISIFALNLLLITPVMAVCPVHNQNCYRHNNCPYNNSTSGTSHPVYLVDSVLKTEEVKFPHCDEHYLVTETTTNHYSDGTRRVFSHSTIYNADGSVLIDNCTNVKHLIYNNEHYFLIKQGRYYKIIDEEAKDITSRHYTYMEEIPTNKFLAKYDNNYGIIDVNEKIIVPFKYKEFTHEHDNIYLTKQNRYYGLMTSENEILIPNDCEKIKPLLEAYLLKRYNKYGLADYDGNMILQTEFDKIKKLGEYIIAIKDKKYFVYDYQGNKLSDVSYKNVKFERNKIYGQNTSGNWVLIEGI